MERSTLYTDCWYRGFYTGLIDFSKIHQILERNVWTLVTLRGFKTLKISKLPYLIEDPWDRHCKYFQIKSFVIILGLCKEKFQVKWSHVAGKIWETVLLNHTGCGFPFDEIFTRLLCAFGCEIFPSTADSSTSELFGLDCIPCHVKPKQIGSHVNFIRKKYGYAILCSLERVFSQTITSLNRCLWYNILGFRDIAIQLEVSWNGTFYTSRSTACRDESNWSYCCVCSLYELFLYSHLFLYRIKSAQGSRSIRWNFWLHPA